MKKGTVVIRGDSLNLRILEECGLTKDVKVMFDYYENLKLNPSIDITQFIIKGTKYVKPTKKGNSTE